MRHCLLETRGENAIFCLFLGDINPRILISYLPSPVVDSKLYIFPGIAECMPPYDSINDISALPFPHLFPRIRKTAMMFPPPLTFRRGQLSP